MATLIFRCVTHFIVQNFIEHDLNHKVHKEENTKDTEISPCSLCETL